MAVTKEDVDKAKAAAKAAGACFGSDDDLAWAAYADDAWDKYWELKEAYDNESN